MKRDTGSKVVPIGAPGVRICGNISASVPISVDCVVEGNVKSDTLVTLAKNAELTGDIEAASVVVEGFVDSGTIKAAGTVSLKDGCVVQGSIQSEYFAVDMGAVFNGGYTTTRSLSRKDDIATEPDTPRPIPVPSTVAKTVNTKTRNKNNKSKGERK